MAFRLSHPRLLVFVTAVFLSFSVYDRVSDWCQEKEKERSYPWSSLPQGLEGVVCPGVYAIHQAYSKICPNAKSGFSEWIISLRDASIGFKNGLCRNGDGAYEILTLRKSSAKVRAGIDAMQETMVTACDWMYQLLGRKPTHSCFFNDNTPTVGFYDDLWTVDFFDPESSCNCELPEEDDLNNEETTFAYWYLLSGCIGAVLLAGGYLIYLLRRRKGEQVPKEVITVWTSLTGAVVSRFKALKLLRANTNTNTFLMSCRKTNKLVYMKCLRSGCSRMARKKLSSELRALKVLEHPNIVNLVDTFHVGQRFSLGLEFAAYGSLDKVMAKDPESFELADTRAVYRQIIDAVAWIHSQSWVHLNIRAGSILVFDKWSFVKLSGFCRATKLVGGTLCDIFDLHRACCSPKVLQKIPYNPVQADIWALRSLFVYMSTGQQLKPGQDVEHPLNIDISVCDWDGNPPDQSLNLLKVLSQFASGEPFDHSYLSMMD